MYLSGPIVLALASHGRPDGIPVDGGMVEVRTVLDSLRYAADLRLLHFSACLMMQDAASAGTLQALSSEARLPLSGYTTSVNWAASAIIEFAYFEMILNKGMTPPQAAEQVRLLLPFAGDSEMPGAAFPPAGFRLILPEAVPERRKRRRAGPARRTSLDGKHGKALPRKRATRS
jgi:hypothetical protein